MQGAHLQLRATRLGEGPRGKTKALQHTIHLRGAGTGSLGRGSLGLCSTRRSELCKYSHCLLAHRTQAPQSALGAERDQHSPHLHLAAPPSLHPSPGLAPPPLPHLRPCGAGRRGGRPWERLCYRTPGGEEDGWRQSGQVLPGREGFVAPEEAGNQTWLPDFHFRWRVRWELPVPLPRGLFPKCPTGLERPFLIPLLSTRLPHQV